MEEESEELVPQPADGLNPEQSRVWDENHKAITDCIRQYIQSNAQTPSVSLIAKQTGLSRPTVRKHIREFAGTTDFQEHTAIFKLMTTDILRQLYSQAINGEVKAARLYMELMGVLKYNTLAENNFIHVPPKKLRLDDIEITEEFFNSLSPGLRSQLETTLREGQLDMKMRGVTLKKSEK